jgi:hypothetical protein
MIALTEEAKQQILDEEPGGLWFILDEEYPRDLATASDLLGEDLPIPSIRQPRTASLAVPAHVCGARAWD